MRTGFAFDPATTAGVNRARLWLRNSQLLSGIPQGDMDAFLEDVRIRSYADQDPVCRQGEPATSLFLVLSGRLLRANRNEPGGPVDCGFLERGDLIGDTVFGGRAVYPWSVSAVGPATLAEVPAKLLQGRAENNPDVIAPFLARLTPSAEP
jgi:CRP-like cAMP-binding protein